MFSGFNFNQTKSHRFPIEKYTEMVTHVFEHAMETRMSAKCTHQHYGVFGFPTNETNTLYCSSIVMYVANVPLEGDVRVDIVAMLFPETASFKLPEGRSIRDMLDDNYMRMVTKAVTSHMSRVINGRRLKFSRQAVTEALRSLENPLELANIIRSVVHALTPNNPWVWNDSVTEWEEQAAVVEKQVQKITHSRPAAFSSRTGRLIPAGTLVLKAAHAKYTEGHGVSLRCKWVDEAGIEWDINASTAEEDLEPMTWPIDIRAKYIVIYQRYKDSDLSTCPMTANSLSEAVTLIKEYLHKTHRPFVDSSFRLLRVCKPDPETTT